MSFPSVITLTEDNGTTTTKKRLAVYAIITLEEITKVLVLVKEPRHLRFYFGAEKIPWYYYQRSHWDREVVAFARDVVEGMLPPTVQINHKWWEPHDRRIVLVTTSATALLALTPTATKVGYATQTAEESSLCFISLDPMKLVSPLLNPPLLSTTATYYLIDSRAAALNFTKAVQQVLTWIRGCLLDAAPGIVILGALDLEDFLTIRRRNIYVVP